MEVFFHYILIGFLVTLTMLVTVVIVILLKKKKIQIQDKSIFVKEVLPAYILASFLFGVVIWIVMEDVSTFTIIILIGIPGALLSGLMKLT